MLSSIAQALRIAGASGGDPSPRSRQTADSDGANLPAGQATAARAAEGAEAAESRRTGLLPTVDEAVDADAPAGPRPAFEMTLMEKMRTEQMRAPEPEPEDDPADPAEATMDPAASGDAAPGTDPATADAADAATAPAADPAVDGAESRQAGPEDSAAVSARSYTEARRATAAGDGPSPGLDERR